ncbi:hypothetical protein [Dictyobacter aurantiacus]|uniref:Uncharacterized protein n=1 Tax=Dictyobacter aurantiacus TaxID=1936993 RepID=A0A401ZJP8_9CHLR|nr:hypothetical protein [Dictyobacter aurantiacus]GCE07048.1 hypothetical protein KDAU_43770 [Dictyobacter aurantiacus]
MQRKDPMQRNQRFIFILAGALLLLMLGEAIFYTRIGGFSYFAYGSFIFCTLLLGTVFFVTRRTYRRMEQRRQRALSGDAALLAQPQPQPDANALALPVKIVLRPSKTILLEFLAICYGLLALVVCVPIILFFLSHHSSSITIKAVASNGHVNSAQPPILYATLPMIIGVILAVLFVICLISFVFTVLASESRSRQEIEVDEQGISTRFLGVVTRMSWDEVLSFAMWGRANSRTALLFELVSKDAVARWYQLSYRHAFYTWLAALKPAMPIDEYRRVMNALPQVIVARTGKPLYDLRHPYSRT